MSALDLIQIRVEPCDAASGGNALALLHEIETLLAHYLASGEPGLIDLRGIPMSPHDYQRLQTLLGQGEITAHLDASGPSEIRETAHAGVWWLTHRNIENEVVADLIEIAAIPQILMSQPEDMQAGLDKLRCALAENKEREHG